MHKLRVTVEGKAYDVAVEVLDESTSTPSSYSAAWVTHPQPPPTPPPGPTTSTAATTAPTGAAKTSAAGAVLSPLAGKVVAVDVKPGMEVVEGAPVLTLEAMKMNTFVYAPKAGTVAAVHVNSGDAVEEGAPLLTIL